MIVRLAQIYVLWFRAGRPGIPGMRPEHEVDAVEA